MASVQYLFSDAHFLPLEIIKRCSLSGEKEKQIYFSAVRIQRLFRGYRVRQLMKRWNKKATIIQKHVRGWLVRWHLPELYAELLDLKYQRYYHAMATKIQAFWRGYSYRKRDDAVNVKKARQERRAIEKRDAEIQRDLQELFAKLKEEQKKYNQKEEECKKTVIFLLYKLHHLLRTQQKEGVYSLHGTRQLSALEVLMKALPFTEYMKELRKVYERESRKKVHQYVFESKQLQKLEDLYQLRDKDMDVKKEKPVESYSKEFILSKKVDRSPYERMVTTQGVYPNPKLILRETDPTKNISKTCLPKKREYLPYYIDFWAKSCPLHNPPPCFE